MQPPAEHVHWLFAAGFLLLGLTLAAEAIVGRELWRKRPWRAYLFPSLAFTSGLFLWPVMVFFTNSTIHMLAHGVWAQSVMVAGAAQLGLVRGKLKHPVWELTVPAAMFVSGAAFLIHEQNGWLFSRSAFLHHALGWTLVAGAAVALARAFRPHARVPSFGFAFVMIVIAMLLFADRDVAPIFGHLDPLAGEPRR